MMQLQQQERKRKKYSERRILSLGSEFQSAAEMIYQTQQSTQRIHKIFSQRGISSHRSRTISHGNLQNKSNNQQPYSEYTPNNLATKSARVSWRHHSSGIGGGIGSNYQSHYNKDSSQIPQNPFHQQPSQSGASVGYHSVGSYYNHQQQGSKLSINQQPFSDDDPYNQKSISGPRKSQPQPVLTTEESLLQRDSVTKNEQQRDNINEESPIQSSQEPKRGLSRTRSQDYLQRRKINNYMKRGDGNLFPSNINTNEQKHLRKPSPQMLEFFKQDKSIQEDMDDQTIAIIDGEQFSPLNKKGPIGKNPQKYHSIEILDPSQSQEPDDLYMEMMAGEINAEDLVRSTQKNQNASDIINKNKQKNIPPTLCLDKEEDGRVDIGEQQLQQFDGRNLYQHTSDLGRAAPTLLTQKQEFNKLHSVYDLKKTLEEVRKQSRSGANNQNFLDEYDEQNENYLSVGLEKIENANLGDQGFASNYPNELENQHRQLNQVGNYDQFFGPGGLQSPRTIPDIDIHNLLLNSGSFGGTDKIKSMKIKTRQGDSQDEKRLEGSLKSLEVLEHLESDPHILLEDAAAGRSGSGDIGSDDDTFSTNNKAKEHSRSGQGQISDELRNDKEVSSASITPEESKQSIHLNKDIAVSKSALPTPQIQKLPNNNGTDTSDLDDRMNIRNNQRHAAEIAIELHSFSSLEQLLADQSGLKEKALDLISDQVFQAIVNRDLILAPYLFPDRQEESLIRASLRQQQNLENQNNANAAIPALLKIPGVNTSFGAIAQYLDNVIGEILMNQFVNKDLSDKLKEPIEKDPYQVLEQLQNSQIGSYSHFLKPQYCQEKEVEQSGKIKPPVSKKLFQDIQRKMFQHENQQEEEKKRKNSIDATSEESEELKAKKEQIQQLVNQSKNMHSMMIFDSLNEVLDSERPYGTTGVPMPWVLGKKLLQCERSAFAPNEDPEEVKNDSKIILKKRTMRNISLKQKLERAKQKVLMNSAFRAGVFPSMLFVHEGVFDEEQFSTERERRLAALLANEVIQSEKNWLQYGFEQAQVKIDLGDMILQRLVTQSIYIMDGIEQNRIHQKLQNEQGANIVGKSIFAQGGFLQQQQELFQLTMSRSMNQNMIVANQNNNANFNNNNIRQSNLNQIGENIMNENPGIVQNIRRESIGTSQNGGGVSPNNNQHTDGDYTGGTSMVIDNIETDSPTNANQSCENAYNDDFDI